MSIDRKADRAIYRQLADVIRDRIVAGVLCAGAYLPAEHVLAEGYKVGRYTVRQAIAVLRAEGLISTSPRGTQVRSRPRRASIQLGRGQRAVVRMPTAHERQALVMDEGIPLIELHSRACGSVDLLPGDRVELEVSAPLGEQ